MYRTVIVERLLYATPAQKGLGLWPFHRVNAYEVETEFEAGRFDLGVGRLSHVTPLDPSTCTRSRAADQLC